MNGLTKQQAKALDFIKRYMTDHGGVPPSFQEIRVQMGLRSTSGAKRLVDCLVERGAVTHIPHRARSISLVEREPSFTDRLNDYCRRSGKLPAEVIETALNEYFAVHHFPGEPS